MCQCQNRDSRSTTCCRNNSPALEGEISSGGVNRQSPAYIRWGQSSLNGILGLRLAVDGDNGTQTRSAIRSFQQRARLDCGWRKSAADFRQRQRAGFLIENKLLKVEQ